MAEYFGYGERLHHEVPSWVDPGALFHIRIRCAPDNPVPLTESKLASKLLDSVQFYRDRKIWHPTVFLLMPDHLHALIAFAADRAMSRVISDWKRFQASGNGVRWQNNFFDHRLRNDEQLGVKCEYILNNPVVRGLCATPDEWPWKMLG